MTETFIKYLCEDGKRTIKGLSLTSVYYIEAIDLLEKRYGNTQILISAYTKLLVLLPVTCGENDVHCLRLLHDQIECSIRNLRSLDVDISTYRVLLAPLVTGKISHNLRLLIAKNLETKNEILKRC